MAGPTMPEILHDAAARVRQIPGFVPAWVYYPQPDAIEGGPSAILRDRGLILARANAEGQEWIARFMVRILVPSQRETPREETKLDTLYTLVIDAFDPRGWGGHIMDILPTVSGHVDSIDPAQDNPVVRGETEYAGQFCYAVDVTLEARFTRQPDLIPIGGTP